MKICYLANTAIPSTNASAIQIVKMCESFSKLDHKVLLITTNVSDKKVFSFYDVKSRFQIKKLGKFKKFPLGLKYYLFSILSIIESIKFKPDIYITRNYFTSFILTVLKKKNILELHHGIEMESRTIRMILKFINFFNSKSLVMLLAITNSVKNYYKKNFNIDDTKFFVSASGSSIQINSKNQFLKKNKRLNIGYFGSLYKSRGIDLILRLSQIDKENKYFVYGDLNQFKNIKYKFCNRNLHINDYLPYKDISRNISKMDILLMPYKDKIVSAGNVGNIIKFTSPLKLFDYLASGKIILSSNLDVLKEIIRDKKNVIFVRNFKNIYSWKNEIKKIKFLREKGLIMSKNNINLSKNFRIQKRAKEILDRIY